MRSKTQHITDLEIDLTLGDMLRVMGCPPPERLRPEHREMAERILVNARKMLQPRGVYLIRPVSWMTDDELQLEGCPVITGPIAEFLKPARRVAVFVVTVGPEISRRAEECMRDGRKLEGYMLDAIGSSAADAAADAMTNHVYWHEAGPDEAVTPPFSPGYCGMSLDEQKTLFSIIDASPIGVRLTPAMIMEPLKSVSGLFGIGESSEVIARGVPCRWCEAHECKTRRAARTSE